MNAKVGLYVARLSHEGRHAELQSLMEHQFLLFLSFLFLLLVTKLPQSCSPRVLAVKRVLSVAASESTGGFFSLPRAGLCCLFCYIQCLVCISVVKWKCFAFNGDVLAKWTAVN